MLYHYGFDDAESSLVEDSLNQTTVASHLGCPAFYAFLVGDEVEFAISTDRAFMVLNEQAELLDIDHFISQFLLTRLKRD